MAGSLNLFPLRGSPLREVAGVFTTVQIVGPNGGVSSSLNLTNVQGFTPKVLSGSSPNQFADQFAIRWNASGSYTLNLSNLWAQLVSYDITIGAQATSISGSGGKDVSWTAIKDIGIPDLGQSATSSFGVGTTGGVNQFSFALLKSGSMADPSGTEEVDVGITLWLRPSTGTGYFFS